MYCFTSILFIFAPMRIFLSLKISNNEINSDGIEYFTNTWAVRILGGPKKARGIAGSLGFEIAEKVS